MQELFAHLSENIYIISASLLFFGFLTGFVVNKFKFPRVTGYIIAGIIFGPSLINIFNEETLIHLDFVPQLALGIIAVIIGSGLSIDLIRRLKFRLIIILMFESFGAFLFVFFVLTLFRMPLGAVLPLSAIAAATAPAATLYVIKECRATGPLTETALAIVALDDAVAIILFGLIMTIDIGHLESLGSAALHSFYISGVEVFLAMLFGLILGSVAHYLIRITRDVTDSLIIVLGAVFLGVGLANIFEVSALLVNMFVGFFLINISPRNSDAIDHLEKMTPPIYCFFFVLAGAHLNVGVFATVGFVVLLWSVLFVVSRILGKIVGAYLAGTISKAPQTLRKYLGMTLAPQAGVAIGLSLLITSASGYYDYKAIVLNVTVIGVAFNELIGPLFTKYALFKAGEAEEVRDKSYKLPGT